MSRPAPGVHAFVDVPASASSAATAFWSAMSGYAASPAWDAHPEFVSLVPPRGAPYLHVQTIDGPPRVHLDLLGDIEHEPARLERLGARPEHPGDGWFTMSSPAGLPFCVCSDPPGPRPPAVRWPGGQRSRAVQLCVDVPYAAFDAEVEFWRAATGWADEHLHLPEFRRLIHRASSPVQLLVQRLGPDDPGTAARAHLDLGADDIGAELARAQVLGAQLVAAGDDIAVLTDPVGLPFCITGNDPDA